VWQGVEFPIDLRRRPYNTVTTVRVCDYSVNITSKAMQYWHDIVTHICCYTRVELIAIYIVTIRSIWHNSAADLLRFAKLTPQICDSCGATYRCNYEAFSALYNTSSPLTHGGNCIQIDA